MMVGGSTGNRMYGEFCCSVATVTRRSYPQTGPNEQPLWVITEPYKPIHQCPSQPNTVCVCERGREGMVQTLSLPLFVVWP